jgi:hypothetical protein
MLGHADPAEPGCLYSTQELILSDRDKISTAGIATVEVSAWTSCYWMQPDAGLDVETIRRPK